MKITFEIDGDKISYLAMTKFILADSFSKQELEDNCKWISEEIEKARQSIEKNPEKWKQKIEQYKVNL